MAAASRDARSASTSADQAAALAAWRRLDREAAAGGAGAAPGAAWASRALDAAHGLAAAGATDAAAAAVVSLASRTVDVPRADARRVAAALGAGARRPADAARALLALPPHGGAYWAAAIKGAAGRGSVASVRGLLAAALADERLAGGPGEARVRLEAVVAYGALKRPAAAVREYEAGVKEGLWRVSDTQPLNTALNAAAWGPLRRATDLADAAAAGGARFDLVTYNTLLKAAMRAARADPRRAAAAAERTLRSLRAAGLSGDEYTYNSAVKVFAYGGDAGRALRVLDDVAAAGGAPTRAVWGSLLVAAGRAGLTDVCRRLWADMEAAGVAPGLDGWHARLQAAAYSLAADDAVDALNGMTAADVAPTSLSYNLALKAHAPPPGRGAAAGRLKTGLGLLDAMRSAGVAPDVATFTSLIGLAAGAGAAEAAVALFEAALAAGVRPDARCYEALWAACRTPETAGAALTTFRRAVWGPRRGRPRRAGFHALAASLLDAGRPRDAARIAAGAATAGCPLPGAALARLTAALAAGGAPRGELASLLLPALGAAPAVAGGASLLPLAALDAAEARTAVLCALARYAAGDDPVPPGGLAVDLGTPERPGVRAALVRLLEGELRLGSADGAAGERLVVPAAALDRWLAGRSGRG